jgi:cytochrome c556
MRRGAGSWSASEFTNSNDATLRGKQSMQRMTIAVAVGLIATCLGAAEPDPIHERHEMMEDTRDALKPMAQMVKGERDFDATTVSAGLATMQHVAEHFGSLFPPGSESGGKTEAKPEIWSDRAGFEQALDEFAAAVDKAATAAPQSVDELKPLLGGITRTCKGCHDTYRLKDEE